MAIFSLPYAYLILCFSSLVCGISVSQIKSLFEDKYCILGTLSSILHNENEGAEGYHTFMSTKDDTIMEHVNEDKSAMSYINELAQYNSIKIRYELINEEGPPHSKTFSVTLYLGDEQYTSSDKSIKKAQQNAAVLALKSTSYQHPPVKIKESPNSLTPTVLLNNLAAKLGLAVSYQLITDDLLGNITEKEMEFAPRKSYLQKLNETLYSNGTVHIRKDGSDLKGPFRIQVDVNGLKFVGEDHTIQNAKHKAAAKALKSLKNQEHNLFCLSDDNSDECKIAKDNIKSPISLVYEAAQKRNLDVTFEVIDETGPAHKKTFITKCVAGNLEATGQGKSKKESKRYAAENILPKLTDMPEVEGKKKEFVSSNKKAKKRKQSKVIKTTMDKIDAMFDDVMDFGKSVFNRVTGDEDSSSDDNTKPQKKGTSPLDEIMQIGGALNLEIQFSDFTENEKYYSLVDLGTKPSFICYGEGINKKNSRDLAANRGIKMIYKLGLLDDFYQTMKERNSLDKEESYQYILLEGAEHETEKEG